MTQIAEEGWIRRAARHLLEDLQPFPGRFYLALSIGIICAVSTSFAMIYKLPEAAIGCYLVIFLMKADAAENILAGVGIIVAVSLVVILLIGIINLTIESPPARIAAIVLVSFVFLYLDSCSQLGENAGIVALVIAFVLTLMDIIPLGEVATRAVLYAWAMVALPMAVMIVYNLFFGMWPQNLLRQTVIERLELAADYLENPTTRNREKLRDALEEGEGEQTKRLLLIKVLNLLPASQQSYLLRARSHSYKLMLAVMAFDKTLNAELRGSLAHSCKVLAQKLAAQKNHEPINATFADEDITQAREIPEILEDLAQGRDPGKQAPVSDPFIAKDALSNPIHLHFALKTTLAAVTCYFIYSAADWQGIHTAMITCYVAALGTTGDTVHKLVLRITGCLIGAFFGLISILYLIPHMESVGSLAFMIFFFVSIAAWVSTGNERISYGGVQIALAFLLTTLQGFGPGTSLSAASDRIIGILLGNCVIFIIFTTIWPVSVTYAIRTRLESALGKLQQLAQLDFSQRNASTNLMASVENDLGVVHNSLRMASYEPRSLRPHNETRKTFDALAEELNQLALKLFFKPDISVATQSALADFHEKITHAELAADALPPEAIKRDAEPSQ